jgi:Fe-S-cluster containining protein
MGDSESAKRHARLYKKIPSFQCIEGCTDCCGPVPWTKWELARAGLDAPPPERDDKKCPFSLAGGCDIHARRPLMCRIFGTVEDLKCPHGKGPLQLLSLADGHGIVAKYKRMV